MSIRPDIIVMCNSEMAFPTMMNIAGLGLLRAVIVPGRNHDLVGLLESSLKGSGIDLVTVSKKDLSAKTKAVIQSKKAVATLIISFPFIITSDLLKLPGHRFINFHYGLLPRYRGHNPVLAQMLQYEEFSGVTLHLVTEKVDSGPIIIQERIPIKDDDTYGMQVSKLSQLSAQLVMPLVNMMSAQVALPTIIQDETKANYFKKVTATELMINWSGMSAWKIVRLVNACNPWNKGAGTIIRKQGLYVTHAEIAGEIQEQTFPGTVIKLNEEEGLHVSTVDHKLIRVNVVYTSDGFFPSKKLMQYLISEGDRFEN